MLPAPRLTDPARRAEVVRELQRPERLAALYATGLLDTPPEEAFDRWTGFLRDALGVRVSVLSLVDRDRQFFESGQTDGPAEDRVTETPVEGSMCQYVVASGGDFVVEDAREDADLAGSMAVQELGTIAYAGTPVHAAGQVIGALCVTERRARAWRDHELALLRHVSAAISSELEVRSAAGRLAQARAALTHQARVHQLIAVGASLADVLALLTEGIEREVPGARATFEAAGDPAVAPWEIAIPGDASRGVLRVRGAQASEPDDAQAHALADAATLAAVALERERTLEQLTRRATLDGLTGLPNRSLFLDRLTQGLARARRSGATTVVAFVDLDRFKTVNDSYGHAAGDKLLAEVARRLDASVRAADTVGRLGGDEFAILAEDVAGRHEAVRIAERLLRSLTCDVGLGRGVAVDPRASVGVAVVPAGDVEPDEILRRADAAMYAPNAPAAPGWPTTTTRCATRRPRG